MINVITTILIQNENSVIKSSCASISLFGMLILFSSISNERSTGKVLLWCCFLLADMNLLFSTRQRWSVDSYNEDRLLSITDRWAPTILCHLLATYVPKIVDFIYTVVHREIASNQQQVDVVITTCSITLSFSVPLPHPYSSSVQPRNQYILVLLLYVYRSHLYAMPSLGHHFPYL